ncbi:Ig-like domain-containing protein, partial [Desulfococcaceae bacterium OttesenSCG-928-F15]|nr:Ig-like domain-containing protein [Desulfococcaceae bacterium OttesenSCG-928-F15]
DDGTFIYIARVEDAAGNQGPESNAYAIMLDTTPPGEEEGYAITIDYYADDVPPEIGNFLDGTTTNDPTPTLNGTVAGLKDGDYINIYEGGLILGTAMVTDGNWIFIIPSEAGEGEHTYTAQIVDAAGNPGISASLNLTVDTSAPSETDGYAIAIVDYTDSVDPEEGNFPGGTSTNDAQPILNGTVAGLKTGDYIRIYEGDLALGEAKVTGSDPDAQWIFEIPETSDGQHTYTARIVDAAGNLGIFDTLTLTVDTRAPSAEDGYEIAIVNYRDDVAPNIGEYSADIPTNDKTPTLNGTVAGLKTGDYIRIYEGDLILGTATVTDGNWIFTITPAADEGEHTYTARIVDAAGNLGIEDSLTLTVDTTAPGADDGYAITFDSYTDNVDPEQGNFGPGTTTNDPNPILNGTVAGLKPGDTVNIYEEGTFLGTATVDSETQWHFTVPSSDNGQHTYTAVIVDAAGNEGINASLTLTINLGVWDGYEIAIVDYMDDENPDQGNFGDNTTTNDKTPTLNGTVVGLKTDDYISIYEGAQFLGTATVTDGSWTFEIPSASDGKHTYTAQIVDGAGNQGPSASLSLTVDTKAPSAEDGYAITLDSYTDNIDPEKGEFLGGTSTNDTQPILNGTVAGLKTGDFIRIYEGDLALGEAKVTDGSWAFTVTPEADQGEHTYTARIVDAAGNLGISASLTLTVDTTAPGADDGYAITFDSYTDDADPDQGTFGTNTTTNDTTPTLNGTVTGLNEGDYIRIYEGTTSLGTATVTDGNWTFTITSEAGEGEHTYTAQIVDAAGNPGISASLTLTVDTTAPSAEDGYEIAIVDYTDDVNPEQGNFVGGTTTNDPTPTLNGTVAGLKPGDTVNIYEGAGFLGTAVVTGTDPDATWSFDIPVTSDGTHIYTARIVDAAGNLGLYDTLTLTVDTQAPRASVTITQIMDNVDPQTGDIGNGGTTNDITPQLHGIVGGSVSAGDHVEILRDGVVVGSASISNGSWFWTDSNLEDGGRYMYTARVVDAAGNLGAISSPYVIHVDLGTPTLSVTIGEVWDDQVPHVGPVVDGGTTDDATPTLRGAINGGLLGANEAVVLYRSSDHGSTWIEVARMQPSEAVWEYTDSGLVSGETYTYRARVENAAGKGGAYS